VTATHLIEFDPTVPGIVGHHNLGGLEKDDHSQYALLAGMSGNLNLGNYSIVINSDPSTTRWSGEISVMKVDWNDNGMGTPLHMKSNGNWEQCIAADEMPRRIPCTAIALEEGKGTKKILWRGIVKKDSWTWTTGNIIYVSTVEGALTNTQPRSTGDIVQPIGIAIASNTIRFDPSLLWVKIE